MLARMWEKKGTLIHCWWECKVVQSLWKIWRCLKNVKLDLPYDPAIPLLGIYPKECDSGLRYGLRKCGIYIQWNFIWPQRRMKFCHLQVNEWNWRTSS
jgi:hypothetical protein